MNIEKDCICVLVGLSPYERATYRYPPLLAVLLVPIYSWNCPIFGKLLFTFADIVIIYLIPQIIDQVASYQELHKGSYRLIKLSSIATFIWAVNPIAANICTRGSSDSISNVAMLCFITTILHKKIFTSAFILGFLIYWRVYPIIYLPAALAFILSGHQRSDPADATVINYKIIYSNMSAALKFVLVSLLTLCGLVGISYYFYGQPYLDESILYHLTRVDHRHNFSPYFYVYYFEKSMEAINGPSNPDATTIFTLLDKLSPSIPQILLNLVVSWHTLRGSLTLSASFLLITIIFVTYNKVITAQYFTWYLCLAPTTIVEALLSPQYSVLTIEELYSRGRQLIIKVALWILSLVIWLYWAYRLEFKGEEVFSAVWMASLLFHLANVACIVELFKCLHNRTEL